MTTILIVDDHPLSREGTMSALRELTLDLRFQEAGSLSEAFRILAGCHADIVLLDLDLGQGQTRGIATLQALWAWLDEHDRETRIIVLSGLTDPAFMRQALEHFASGFIPKAARRETLQRAVKLTLAGGIFMPEQAAHDGPAAEHARMGAAALIKRLTTRERAVAAQLIKGLTYKRIAKNLQSLDGRPISEHTVRAHVGNIAWKLGVAENAKAGVMAYIALHGLLFNEPSDDT
jgi:DNA-binding NarL/FixJ family response regulator